MRGCYSHCTDRGGDRTGRFYWRRRSGVGFRLVAAEVSRQPGEGAEELDTGVWSLGRTELEV